MGRDRKRQRERKRVGDHGKEGWEGVERKEKKSYLITIISNILLHPKLSHQNKQKTC